MEGRRPALARRHLAPGVTNGREAMSESDLDDALRVAPCCETCAKARGLLHHRRTPSYATKACRHCSGETTGRVRAADINAPAVERWTCPDCEISILGPALAEARRLGGPVACGGEYLENPIPAIHTPGWTSLRGRGQQRPAS